MTGISLPPLDIPALLKQFGLRPSKGLGQNFLQDDRALQDIVTSADITPSDDVLEIGPGLGNLTRYLALAAHTVTAVELDKALFPALKTVVAPYQNVRLVQGDILRLNPADLMNIAGLSGGRQHPLLHHLGCSPSPVGKRRAPPPAGADGAGRSGQTDLRQTRKDEPVILECSGLR